MKTHAPIALFAFNRPEHLQRTLQALATNELASESSITIFCDGPRTKEESKLSDATRQVAHGAQGFASVTVIEREKNMGCAASVIDGLQYMFARSEQVIVIEDDVLCSQHTLDFLNSGLQKYDDEKEIFALSAWSLPASLLPIPQNYTHDVYVIPRFNCSGGWASWRDRFKYVDWTVADYEDFIYSPEQRKAFTQGGEDLPFMLDDQMQGKINSWAVRAEYARFKQKQVCINPVISYTTNIGYGSGTHTTEYTDVFDNDISKAISADKVCWVDSLQVHAEILPKYRAVYALPPLWRRFSSALLKKMGLFPLAKKIYTRYIKR